MELWLASSFVTILVALITSTGFWAFIQKRDTLRKSTEQLLLGLTYDRIVHLGMKYIDRGFVTKDEYEDLMKFFYKPYKDLGGNGMAERIMNEVSRLPIRSSRKVVEDLRHGKEEDQ